MAGLEYRRLAHEFFRGELTAKQLAECVEYLRRRGPQMGLFKPEDLKEVKDAKRLRAGR